MLGNYRLRLAAIATSLSAVGLIGASAIGQTAEASGSNLCQTNQVCIFEDANYIGELGWRPAGGTVQNVSAGANDKMSSYENLTNTNARWYYNVNGSGTCETMWAQQRKPQSANQDELSSWATNGQC